MTLNYFMSFKCLHNDCHIDTHKTTSHFFTVTRISVVMMFRDSLEILAVLRYASVKREDETRELEFNRLFK